MSIACQKLYLIFPNLYRSLCQNRQYSDIASLLQGVSKVMEHFTPYMDIPQVKELADQVNIDFLDQIIFN